MTDAEGIPSTPSGPGTIASPVPAEERIRPPSQFDDLRRAERTMIVARWLGCAWALLQVLAYEELPYPPGNKTAGVVLGLSFGVVNIGVMFAYRRTRTLSQARVLAITSLSLDILLASGIVWVFAFDVVAASWSVLFVFPLEGALRFRLAGALGSWFAVTVLYIPREIWGSRTYHYEFQWNSITFRMGICLLIAAVAGTMSRSLIQQRSRLGTALAQLERVDRFRSGLISTLAHDVRGPLTVVSGAVEILRARGSSLDEDTRTALLDSAQRQTDRLARLATDLLDLARLETGRLELALEPVELKDAVEKALSFNDSDRQICVQVDPEISMRCDPERLEQVIVNLSANMLRHGAQPFVVEGSRTQSSVSLAFRDNGPGVPEEQRSTLFDPFTTNADTGSAGFGLHIVKGLVEAHGGRVSYEPNEPQGACFRVTLPILGPGARASLRASPGTRDGR